MDESLREPKLELKVTSRRLPWLLEKIRKANFRGKSHLVRNLPWRLPDEVIADCDGFLYRLFLNDDIQFEIYFNIFSNLEIFQLEKLIPSGGICLDIGAHIGYYSLHLARCVGGDGRVYSFEPDSGIRDRLNENIRLNAMNNVSVFPFAVTNKTGLASFYPSDQSHSGWGSLTEFKDISAGRTEVQTTTLDEFIKNEKIRRIDLLKVDVEAQEFELIEGACRSFEETRFSYVFIEFNGPRLYQRGKSFGEFINMFKQLGYAPVILNLPLLEKFKDGRADPSQVVTNFIFAPEKR